MSILRRTPDWKLGYKLPDDFHVDEPQNHRQMTYRAARWLVSSGCCFAFFECGSYHIASIPDALGFHNDGTSIVIECKMSRADFFADRNKPHRQEPSALGKRRYFLTPKNLVRVEELPKGWGLLYQQKSKVYVIQASAHFPGDDGAEKAFLISALGFEKKLVAKCIADSPITCPRCGSTNDGHETWCRDKDQAA